MIAKATVHWDYDGEIREDKVLVYGKNMKKMGEAIDNYYSRDLVDVTFCIIEDESTGVIMMSDLRDWED